ncbi:MAG: ORF6N domain-containing protein [Rickettsiales bacterium]|jgi:phage regulator Rha-like protein|nr:ORF6N domain-containing protein [Rickettsiales bacterium]
MVKKQNNEEKKGTKKGSNISPKNKVTNLTITNNSNNNDVINYDYIKSKIITLRDIPVIIDRDVAEIYGVETREITQAIKNNTDKFPDGFIFELEKKEKDEVIKNFDNLTDIKYSPSPTKAFTEQGLYMLATILRGERATQMTIQIINTFTEFREITRNLDNAGNAKTEQEMGNYLTKAVSNLTNMLLKNIEGDTSKVKTTLELNLGIARAKIETESVKDNSKNNAIVDGANSTNKTKKKEDK